MTTVHPRTPVCPARRVAICCPGPSLATVWPAARERFHQVIAVNFAADRLGGPYDWLAACDGECYLPRHALADPVSEGGCTVRGVWVRPRRGICSWDDRLRDLAAGKYPTWSTIGYHTVPTQALLHDLGHPPHNLSWTIQAALLLGCWLGGGELHVFGCDYRSYPDTYNADHCSPGQQRVGRARFEQEAKDLLDTEATVRRHGCTLTYRS